MKNENETLMESATDIIIDIAAAMDNSTFFKPFSILFDVAIFGLIAASGRLFV